MYRLGVPGYKNAIFTPAVYSFQENRDAIDSRICTSTEGHIAQCLLRICFLSHPFNREVQLVFSCLKFCCNWSLVCIQYGIHYCFNRLKRGPLKFMLHS